jgi:hypothetical protein
MAETEEAEKGIAEIIVGFSEEFDAACEERHLVGAEKYGPGNFLIVDTMEEALDEIVDLANYARYTFIKLRLLQERIREVIADGEGAPTSTPFMNAAGFMGLGN